METYRTHICDSRRATAKVRVVHVMSATCSLFDRKLSTTMRREQLSLLQSCGRVGTYMIAIYMYEYASFYTNAVVCMMLL